MQNFELQEITIIRILVRKLYQHIRKTVIFRANEEHESIYSYVMTFIVTLTV